MKLQENLLEKVCSTFFGELQKILAETQNPKSNLGESTHAEPFVFFLLSDFPLGCFKIAPLS